MPPLIVIENPIIIKQLAVDYIQLSGKHVCLYLHIRQLAHKFCCCPLPFRLIFCQKIVDCFQQGIRRLFPQFRFCLFEFPDAALPVKLYSQFLIRLVTPHYIHDRHIARILPEIPNAHNFPTKL